MQMNGMYVPKIGLLIIELVICYEDSTTFSETLCPQIDRQRIFGLSILTPPPKYYLHNKLHGTEINTRAFVGWISHFQSMGFEKKSRSPFLRGKRESTEREPPPHAYQAPTQAYHPLSQNLPIPCRLTNSVRAGHRGEWEGCLL